MRGRVKAHINWDGYTGGGVILPVCPRSPAIRRRNLVASLEALRERTDRIRLVLCDTLDRHNLSGTDTEREARRAGDQWLQSCLPDIRRFFPSVDQPLNLFRWDDVRKDPSFAQRHDVLITMYRSSEAVRMVIERIAGQYLKKRDAHLKKYGLSFDRDREMARSAVYLIEEFAGTAVYNAWFSGTPEAYWGVYVGNTQIFNQLNTVDKTVDLTLPHTLAIGLRSLEPAVAGERDPSVAA
jgi:hypothetical protein